jgi:ATP-dependent helicase/DNAse subunit B
MKSILQIVVILGLALFASSLFAESSTDKPTTMPMHKDGGMSMESSMMQENMSSMGGMMMKMGNTLEREHMSADQLKECAAHMESLSRIMIKSANDIELKGVKNQKKEIEKLAKEWNYFESKEFESH